METILRVPESAVFGPLPACWFGVDAVDGDAEPWIRAPVGSTYYHKDTTNNLMHAWEKRKADGRDDDWGNLGGVHVVSERVERSQFTDDATTVGKYNMVETIPAGAVVLRTLLKGVVGFIGDTSATIQVGESTGNDVDRFTTGTPSVFTTAANVDAGAVSGAAYVGTAFRPWIHVTANSDFTLVTAGAVTVEIHYLL